MTNPKTIITKIGRELEDIGDEVCRQDGLNEADYQFDARDYDAAAERLDGIYEREDLDEALTTYCPYRHYREECAVLRKLLAIADG